MARALSTTVRTYLPTLPRFGKPFTSVRIKMLQFYRAFEIVMVEKNGVPLTAWEAKLLRTAAKCYGQARRVDLILNKAGQPGSTMTHDQYQGYLDRSIRFEEAADKALR